MAEEKKPAEQELKAQQEIELNDLEQELTAEQQGEVEGGISLPGIFGPEKPRQRRRGA